MIGIFDKRPPFVRFEEREMGLLVKESEEAGRPIPRVVIMALITPHASKDCVEKIAEEWIEQNRQKALKGEYPMEWVRHFKDALEEWKKGHELPREGTPIATWQMATSEARNRLRAIGIPTVEDLAAWPDSNLGVIGMDGRYLRDLAAGWINEAKDKGINTKALADANVRISDLEKSLHRMSEELMHLRRETDEGENRRGGRSRKDAA